MIVIWWNGYLITYDFYNKYLKLQRSSFLSTKYLKLRRLTNIPIIHHGPLPSRLFTLSTQLRWKDKRHLAISSMDTYAHVVDVLTPWNDQPGDTVLRSNPFHPTGHDCHPPSYQKRKRPRLFISSSKFHGDCPATSNCVKEFGKGHQPLGRASAPFFQMNEKGETGWVGMGVEWCQWWCLFMKPVTWSGP